MSTVRFISDLHFSHTSMATKRGFKCAEDHDDYIIAMWNSVVSKRDVTYILGDITMEKKRPYYLLSMLNGSKHVILGNHDRMQDIPSLLQYVDNVCGCMKYKGHILTHIPIIGSEIMGFYVKNIHGHIHEVRPVSDRHINVSCENVGYLPKTLEQLL